MQREGHIGLEIKRLDNEIHSRMAVYRDSVGASELTRMQAWIIGFLYRNEEKEIFQKDIEAEFSIARSTATGILQLMEKKGYLKRQSVERDARLKSVVLTNAGERMHLNIEDNISKMESRLRMGITGEELEVFFRVIRKMRENVEVDDNETDRRRGTCSKRNSQ
ncbi:MAG: MarR family transcriptional regulator [Clostridia bacterium]|nr:MarR family transcriptional regulator [Clostridia bacterium]NCC43233.1 MarR family transcriptional regulator [Clostridia bacterium]